MWTLNLLPGVSEPCVTLISLGFSHCSFLSVVSCITISIMVAVKYIIGYDTKGCTIDRGENFIIPR